MTMDNFMEKAKKLLDGWNEKTDADDDEWYDEEDDDEYDDEYDDYSDIMELYDEGNGGADNW